MLIKLFYVLLYIFTHYPVAGRLIEVELSVL